LESLVIYFVFQEEETEAWPGGSGSENGEGAGGARGAPEVQKNLLGRNLPQVFLCIFVLFCFPQCTVTPNILSRGNNLGLF
jgi:hypothetical protein